jgi:bifunctional NMN adenylyltransferase/nudix hydrolase
MLRAAYPDAIILPIHDCLDDTMWSSRLDEAIRAVIPNVSAAKLYGGRKSFQEHYYGEFTPVEIDSGIEYRSGTHQREAIGKVVRSTSDFRAGIIYSTQNSFPYVKMCVDIACLKQCDEFGHALEEPEILLGRKDSENKWRLPGGGVDKGETLEHAACRELYEETLISTDQKSMRYIQSMPAGDWRFKNAGEIGLMTTLFITQYLWGAPRAGDDLVEVKWFPISQARNAVVKGHKTLITAVWREVKNDKQSNSAN